MNHAAATKAIYQRWIAMWPSLSGGVPYVFDNDLIDEAVLYARVSITTLSEEQHTLGGAGARKFLEPGVINVELYGPGDAGRNQLDTIADYVRTIYQSVRFGATGTEDGIVTFATSIGDERQKADDQYWVMTCTTPFEFFDVR